MGLSKKVLYFAVSAHFPPVVSQVTSKFEAWDWAKKYVRTFMDAPADA